MTTYPDLKNSEFVFVESGNEKSEPLYPHLTSGKDMPPPYSTHHTTDAPEAPPTLCSQCSNAVYLQPVATIPPKTAETATVVHSNDFCKKCVRAKRRMVKKLTKGRFCKCRSSSHKH